MSIPAVILAAGASCRLGKPKQLVELFGEPLLRRTASTVLVGCKPVLVVLGSQAEKVGVSLAGLPVTIVTNKEWQEGVASSIRVGVRALPANAEGVFLFTCDQIALNNVVLMRLLKTQSCHNESVIACEYSGIRGVPAYFPNKYFSKLKALRGDHGAGRFLQVDSVVAVPFPKGEYDIDCPEDLPKYLALDSC